ncbi:MAG: hypothetical protein ACE5O2_04760 [Armatimonadota bacterium]
MPAKLIGLGMNREETRHLPYWDNADWVTLHGGKEARDVRASAWLVPSQGRLIVVASNWNKRAVPCKLRLRMERLSAAAASGGAEVLVTDLETDEALRRGLRVDEIGFTVQPLDFRMLMVTAVAASPWSAPTCNCRPAPTW